jgi:hypothetical protein
MNQKQTQSVPVALQQRLTVILALCHGTSSPLTEGLGTSLYLLGYLNDRPHDLWTVYIAWPLWPFLASFPFHATTILPTVCPVTVCSIYFLVAL